MKNLRIERTIMADNGSSSEEKELNFISSVMKGLKLGDIDADEFNPNGLNMVTIEVPDSDVASYSKDIFELLSVDKDTLKSLLIIAEKFDDNSVAYPTRFALEANNVDLMSTSEFSLSNINGSLSFPDLTIKGLTVASTIYVIYSY